MLRRSINGTPDRHPVPVDRYGRAPQGATNAPPMHCMRDPFATTVRPPCATLARQAFSLN